MTYGQFCFFCPYFFFYLDTCCIADLGLAITRTTVNSGVVNSWRTGTRRYHSPELLNDSMDTSHFDSYLKADIYALGLCIWEVCWRTKFSGNNINGI